MYRYVTDLSLIHWKKQKLERWQISPAWVRLPITEKPESHPAPKYLEMDLFWNGIHLKVNRYLNILKTLWPTKSAQTTTGEQLSSAHLVSKTGRSSTTCTQWHQGCTPPCYDTSLKTGSCVHTECSSFIYSFVQIQIWNVQCRRQYLGWIDALHLVFSELGALSTRYKRWSLVKGVKRDKNDNCWIDETTKPSWTPWEWQRFTKC